MFCQTMFSYNVAYNSPGDIFLWQKLQLFCLHLLAISSLLLPCIAITCHCKSKIQLSFMFFDSITVHCNRPLRKHMLSSAGSKGHVSELGCNWLILIHILFISFCGIMVIIFDKWRFSNVLIFSCNQIGQPCWTSQPRWRISDLHHLT